MAEYIDRNYIVKAYIDLCKALSQKSKICPGADEPTVKNVFAIVMHAPAADVAPVRHGRWIGIEYDGYADGFPVYDLWECSECGEEVKGEDVPVSHPWCHSCGARMDKEDEQ